jgi:hypothetical protein
MPDSLLPPEADLTIGVAHVAYQLGQEFATRGSRARTFEVRSLDELRARVAEADLLVVSGLWRNELIEAAPRLRFIQSISAGTDQFDQAMLTSRDILLASAQGANERAVAEHAMALILALVRQLPQARDNQAKSSWRGMIADRTRREDELGGKLLLIVGLGHIGSRLARLAMSFDMRVVGIRRNPGADDGMPARGGRAAVRRDVVSDLALRAVVRHTPDAQPPRHGHRGPAAGSGADGTLQQGDAALVGGRQRVPPRSSRSCSAQLVGSADQSFVVVTSALIVPFAIASTTLGER